MVLSELVYTLVLGLRGLVETAAGAFLRAPSFTLLCRSSSRCAAVFCEVVPSLLNRLAAPGVWFRPAVLLSLVGRSLEVFFSLAELLRLSWWPTVALLIGGLFLAHWLLSLFATETQPPPCGLVLVLGPAGPILPGLYMLKCQVDWLVMRCADS